RHRMPPGTPGPACDDGKGGSTPAPPEWRRVATELPGYGGVIGCRVRGRGGSLLECGIALNARTADPGRACRSSRGRAWSDPRRFDRRRTGQALRRARLAVAVAGGRQRSGSPPQQLRVRNSTRPFIAAKSARSEERRGGVGVSYRWLL